MSNARRITVTEQERSILEHWQKNRAGTPARLVERSSIILLSADGVGNAEQGRLLGVDRQRIRRWRKRWADNEGRLAEAAWEGVSDRDLKKMLRDLLSDEQRPGVPPTFWFSILVRRALKRASFTSKDDLRQRLLDFIEYFNAVLAKPFRWTYTGKPLMT